MSSLSIKMAQILLDTAALREGSFDVAGAGLATKQDLAAAKEAEKKGDLPPITTDYNQFYKLDLRQAATQVCEKQGEPDLVEFVHTTLHFTWNSALEWAEGLRLKHAGQNIVANIVETPEGFSTGN